MKLYYSPGACSQATHILLREVGIPFTLDRVDTKQQKTEDGRDYQLINSKRTVPCLELDNGERLTEGPAIAQYIADSTSNADLLPALGSIARYRVLEWQNYVTSELHKSFSPLFGRPVLDAPAVGKFKQAISNKLEWVSSQLRDTEYLTGNTFTAADAYLFVVAGWAKHVELDTSGMPDLTRFLARVGERSSVKASLRAEGLA